jgi:hypothetical protein
MRTPFASFPRTRAAAAALLALAATLLASPAAHAQERSSELPRVSPNAAVSQTVGVTDVRITYGRPSVKGRDVFGGLVPYGEVWRTGANEATTISFSNDVRIEGEPLEAGTYGLFTVPGRDSWTVIFNETAEQWGAYEYDESRDALRVNVEPTDAPHPHEQMSFHFGDVTDRSATAALVWDETRVPVRIETDTDAHVRAEADAAAADAEDWRAPLRYAAYALEHDLYPEAALDWVNRSMALGENFQNAAAKARLLASMERYEEARQFAKQAVRMAEEGNGTPQGLEQFEEQVADWP